MTRSNNNINVLSPVFARLTEDNAPQVAYEINSNHYDKGYYLVDGIYPSQSTFVKIVRNPEDEKCKRLVKEQEVSPKDVERAFVVLQSRWAIVQHPARTWSTERIWEVMTTCVIMRNMIIDEERDGNMYDQGWEFQGDLVEPLPGPTSWE
jgi:hypothetical protein